MTDQTDEAPDSIGVEEAQLIDQPVGIDGPEAPGPEGHTETDPVDVAPVAEDEIVPAEIEPDAGRQDAEPEHAAPETESSDAEATALDLGDEAPPAPTGTDFDVAASPHLAEPAPSDDFDFSPSLPPASGAGLSQPPSPPDPVPAPPPAPSAQPASAVPPMTTPAPAPTGGSFLDLPPLPDLNYPAPTPPAASPYPPSPRSYPQVADYPEPEYAPYPVDYGQQAAGRSYGHGVPQRSTAPSGSPYGGPTGFAVAPYQAAPTGDLQMASLAHWGALAATVVSGGSLGFLVPLIIMLTRGQSDPFVRANAVESLNFNLTVLLGMIASALLLLVMVGIVGLIVIPIVALILQILGAIAAGRGEVYRYPISIRFVK